MMRTVLLVAALIGVPAAGVTAIHREGQAPSPDPLVRLRAYLVAYQSKLPSLVAEEHYVQNYSGSAGVTPRKQTTRAELVMVRLPGNAGWFTFRDVFEVDQRPVGDRQERLLKLLQTPTTDALTQARRIAAEGARFNLGRTSRTINVPDIALPYLHPSHQDKVKIDPPRPTTLDGVETLLFRFRETSGPTIIVTPAGQDVRAQGRVWTDAVSGAILRTELTVRERSSTAVCVVDFRLDSRLGALVPSRMSERYSGPNENVDAVATYSNVRQFKVSTAEAVGKPPGL